MKYSFWLTILILQSTIVYSQSELHDIAFDNQNWISLDGTVEYTSPTIQIHESNLLNYVVKVKIHGIRSEKIVEEGIMYNKLSIDDNFTLSNVGEPALPIISQLIGIPSGKEYKASITEEKWMDINNIGKIYPFQELLFENEQSRPFVISDSIYNAYIYNSCVINTSEKMNFRGLENVNFAICPFKYFPSTNKLSVLSEFTFTVTFQKQASIPKINKTENIIHIFNNSQALSSSLSYSSSRKIEKSYLDSYNYLIIIGDNTEIKESKYLKDFCTWKAYKGFKTKIVSTSDIGNDCESIKNYIRTEYDKGVDYVLFIGDYDKIPLYKKKFLVPINNRSDSIKSDYWYGAFDGEEDPQAEVAIGRFATNSLSEFKNIVYKTIKYESIPNDSYNKVLLVAHKECAPWEYQLCSEEIRTAIYKDSMIFYKAYGSSSDYGGTNATNATIREYINSGLNIINYRGHGLAKSWSGWGGGSSSTQSFTYGNAFILKNNINPVVFSVTCLTGNIEEKCLLKGFMNTAYGSVAFIGATEATHTLPNNTYNENLFDELLNNNIYNIGLLNIIAHARVCSRYDKMSFDNAYSYILGNDPALEIWTATPNVFNDISIVRNSDVVTINTGNVKDFDVSIISKDGELLKTEHSNLESVTLQNITEENVIVINKHNYIPYIDNPNGTLYIQNEIIESDKTYKANNITIGANVTEWKPVGDVVFKKGNITMNCESIELTGGTYIEKGAEFKVEIKK